MTHIDIIGACEHETADQRAAVAAGILQHCQCNPSVQVPALHGERDNKATEKQENDLVRVRCRGNVNRS